jgi:hypothetical protein
VWRSFYAKEAAPARDCANRGLNNLLKTAGDRP